MPASATGEGLKYVLRGRVVTMGPQGILNDGAIYIEDGVIVAVQSARKKPPTGFSKVPRVSGGDTIYPGMIELHNHLSYNAMPLWDVPQRFTNNNQWKNHADYRRCITKPSQVLGRTAGLVESVVRFAEMRCMLGGCTTSQGITLSSSPGMRSYYKGIVRNVEQPLQEGLPRAGTKIANPDKGKAEAYFNRLKKQTCYLQHLSEGVDDTARGWFTRLKMSDGQWAINDAFCGIHSTALNAADFEVMAEHGGTAVWSPVSNFLLYGRTMDPNLPKQAGVKMGIGCDWSPSGTKNLLGELKVAWLANLEAGSPYSAEDLVKMATINAAEILKWDHALGSIEPGKRADLVAVNGKKGDDYERLIQARETSITLVVIDGVPRVGQTSLMRRVGGSTESIRVGGSTRKLNLAQPETHPLVRDLTLTEATERLEQAMQQLPELAEKIDAQTARTGLLGGSLGDDGDTWRVVMDIDEDDLGDETALAALPLADFVEPMELPGISVADDRNFLRELVRARNLPEYVKKQLPPMYGKRIPLPESAQFLETNANDLVPEVIGTTDELKDFLRTWGELNREQLIGIVDQALLLLDETYVHLPLKRAMHAVEPIQRLKLLRHRLEHEGAEAWADVEATPDGGAVETAARRAGEARPEIEFHNELARIFNSLRDLHTVYRLPVPFRGKTAWLPILIEEYWKYGKRRYTVSKVVGEVGPEGFEGVEVTHWNGVPMERAVSNNADRHAGSNDAARHARGLHSLTIRPLSHGMPPDEESVTLRYIDEQGQVGYWTQEWLVFEPGRSPGELNPDALSRQAASVGLDPQTDDVQLARKALFAGKIAARERKVGMEGFDKPVVNTRGGVATFLPTVFRAKTVKTDQGEFGYIRIFTFAVNDDQVFLDEFKRLLRALPERGLIVDVRGNGGGLIPAAERLLQLLTPRRIEPERAQFINTPTNLQLCKAWSGPDAAASLIDLGPWVESIAQSVRTGATHSRGFSITDSAAANDTGQRYYGPVVLVVDALCYSATDMFAAGFQDHGIGPILGVDDNTGAGGANVWSHGLLRQLMDGTESADRFQRLPHGADMRVAIRRTVRVGAYAGVVVEDLGIEPDRLHRMTHDDLIHGNRDLIEAAAALLVEQPYRSIKVSFEPRRGRPREVKVITRGVDRLDVSLNGRPHRSVDTSGRSTTISLRGALPRAGQTAELSVDAYYDGELVARHREDVDQR